LPQLIPEEANCGPSPQSCYYSTVRTRTKLGNRAFSVAGPTSYVKQFTSVVTTYRLASANSWNHICSSWRLTTLTVKCHGVTLFFAVGLIWLCITIIPWWWWWRRRRQWWFFTTGLN